MSLLPPSEAVDYPTRKAFFEAIQAHAQANGYAVTTKSSNNIDNIVYLKCDRGGVYWA